MSFGTVSIDLSGYGDQAEYVADPAEWLERHAALVQAAQAQTRALIQVHARTPSRLIGSMSERVREQFVARAGFRDRSRLRSSAPRPYGPPSKGRLFQLSFETQ